MTPTKLASIRREIKALESSQPKAEKLQALARKLGRKEVKRGKEPTFVSMDFPDLRPLSIPKHKGRDMPTGTKNSILAQLDEDVTEWLNKFDEFS